MYQEHRTSLFVSIISEFYIVLSKAFVSLIVSLRFVLKLHGKGVSGLISPP